MIQRQFGVHKMRIFQVPALPTEAPLLRYI